MDDVKPYPIYCTRHLFRGGEGTDEGLSFEAGFHIPRDEFKGLDATYEALAEPGTTDNVLIHAFACPLCDAEDKPDPCVYIVPVSQTTQPVTYLSQPDGEHWMVYSPAGMYTPNPRHNPLTPTFDAENIISEPDTEE